MNTYIVCLFTLLSTSSVVFSQTIGGTLKPQDPTVAVVRGANSGRLGVIDPAITDIRFAYRKETIGDKLRISITVKNVGLKNYESNSNQQNVQLWEEYSSTKRTMVKVFPFQNLNSNATLSFVYERPAFKPSDEFPPNYKAIIVYDPDILTDNNKNNDDANTSNNMLAKNPRE